MKLDYIAPQNTKLHQFSAIGTQEEFKQVLATKGYNLLPHIIRTNKTFVHFVTKNNIYYIAFRTNNTFRLWTVGSQVRPLKENEDEDTFLRKVLNEILIEEYRNHLNKIAVLCTNDTYTNINFESKIL